MQRLLPVFYSLVCFVGVTGLPLNSLDEKIHQPVLSLPQIVNGEDATQGEFPFQCSLKGDFFGFKIHICGAVIFDDMTLITAAHCVESQVASKLRVTCGELDLGKIEVTEQIRNIASYQIHSDRNTTTKEGDLAIFTLTEPLEFNEFVQPVQLADENFLTSDNFDKNQDCVSIGWGNMKPEGSASALVLQKVTLQIVPEDNCKARYEELINITPSMICAGYLDPNSDEEQKGACTGDSGGPLLCSAIEPEGVQKHLLVGIVSFGTKPCAQNIYPSVFASIPYLGNWLRELEGNNPRFSQAEQLITHLK